MPSQWHLASIAVSPKFERRGIGSKLVQYGQKIAAEEKVPVTLNASVKGEGLYTKLGFKLIQKRELMEGLWSKLMVWEPEGCTSTVRSMVEEPTDVIP